jgi:hypothetical protein
LYGDDVSDSDQQQWFADDRRAYADLGAKDRGGYQDRQPHQACNPLAGAADLASPTNLGCGSK